MALEIRELSPARVGDYLAFFDGDGFADNPEWRPCYCRLFHFSGTMDEWDAACASGENRRVKADLIRRGEAHGLPAYSEGRPVGWCHAAPRRSLRLSPKLDVPDADRVGSVVCFVVAAPHRRKGVARLLLRAACDGFARRGLAFAEAYPDLPPADAEHRFMCGPLGLYRSEGFTVFRELGGKAIVRKTLSGATGGG